jgi:hypothetical protein
MEKGRYEDETDNEEDNNKILIIWCGYHRMNVFLLI